MKVKQVVDNSKVLVLVTNHIDINNKQAEQTKVFKNFRVQMVTYPTIFNTIYLKVDKISNTVIVNLLKLDWSENQGVIYPFSD